VACLSSAKKNEQEAGWQLVQKPSLGMQYAKERHQIPHGDWIGTLHAVNEFVDLKVGFSSSVCNITRICPGLLSIKSARIREFKEARGLSLGKASRNPVEAMYKLSQGFPSFELASSRYHLQMLTCGFMNTTIKRGGLPRNHHYWA
jgi:hypothetical protein